MRDFELGNDPEEVERIKKIMAVPINPLKCRYIISPAECKKLKRNTHNPHDVNGQYHSTPADGESYSRQKYLLERKAYKQKAKDQYHNKK